MSLTRPQRLYLPLAVVAIVVLAACGGDGDKKPSGSPTSDDASASAAPADPDGPANGILIIGGAQSTKSALEDALAEGSIEKYFLTNRSMDPAAFEALAIPAEVTVQGTQPVLPAAGAEAFNTAFQDTYGYAATDFPGSAAAYDAVYIAALAAAAANSDDPTFVRDSLNFVANSPGAIVTYGGGEFAGALDLLAQSQDVNYIGASGQVDFDVNGEMSKGAVQTWQVINNLITPFETRDVDAAAESGVEVPTGGNAPGPAAESAFVIGIVITEDETGTAFQDAAQLAVDEINAAGGLFGSDVELAVATMANGGADAAGSLIDVSGARVIIGTTAADAVTDIFNTASAADVPVIGMSAAPELAAVQDDNLLFSILPSDALQMAVLANLALEADANYICVLFEEGAAGQVLADAFKRAIEFKRGAVRDAQSFDPSREDFAELLAGCVGA